ncbi:hypothetical protein BDZ97DRAFT_1788864 [Flammula alnicola]|nr:hypothetical protein BDZ97DRAFT_1788864 [Flammula alnicola]
MPMWPISRSCIVCNTRSPSPMSLIIILVLCNFDRLAHALLMQGTVRAKEIQDKSRPLQMLYIIPSRAVTSSCAWWPVAVA